MMTDRFARVALTVVLGSSIVGCGGGSDSTKPGVVGGGTTASAPIVVQTIPADHSSGAPTDGMVEVVFSQSIDPSTITSSTVGILDSTGTQVPASLAYDDSVLGVTIAPSAPLTSGAPYTIVVAPGLKDAAGVDIGQVVQLSFTVGTGPDQVAPSFSGIASATPDGQGGVTLAWQPATDPVYASNQLYYTIYQGSSAATVDFTHFVLVPFGSTTPHLNLGLSSGQTTFLVARSWNLANKTDGNSKAVSVTGASTQRTAPTFAGATSASAQSPNSVAVSWSAASDAFDAPSAIVYKVFAGTTAGNVNFSTPAATVTGQTSATVGGLSASTTYFFVARAYNTASISDNNSVSVSATTPAGTVTRTAPSFAGASGASAQSTSAILVSWPTATDTVDASSALVYKVYRGTSAGSVNLSSPVAQVTGGTSASVTGLSASTTYFFVVRATNTANMSDANTKVVSATTQQAQATGPSFASAIENGIFNGNNYSCTGCHPGQSSYDLSNWNSVVHSHGSNNSSADVVPGNAGSSYLVRWLFTPTQSGLANTRQSFHTIADSDMTNLKNWINAGAQNN